MTAILLAKALGSLRPVDDAGEEALARIGQGELVRVDMKRPRNVRHHRKFWALAKIVADNSDKWRSAEDVVTALKLATGHVETFRVPDTDRVYEIPKSISFGKMDQGAFDEFYDRCVKVIVARWLPGVTDAELRAEVETMIG